jgi:plastocyanin
MESNTHTPSSAFVSSPSGSTGNNKKRLILIAAAVAVAILLISIVVMLISKSGSDVDAEEPTASVKITDEGFVPATIKIKKGQDIAWVNNRESAHQVFADQSSAPGLDSAEPLTEGDSYIYTFEKTGTFNYYDPLDPSQFKGTVIVE